MSAEPEKTSKPKNYRVILKSRPGANETPKEENFSVVCCPYPDDELEEETVLVKSLYISVDPAMRCRMNEDTGVHYIHPWNLGQCVEGFGGVGKVEKSNSKRFQEGDIVTMGLNWMWQTYFVSEAAALEKVDRTVVGDHVSLVLSCFGLTGLTALLGIWVKGHIKPSCNQTVVVSGAAGATGSLAGQIAKIEGCKQVVGICGSDEKCHFLLKELSFDVSVNYKTESVEERLKKTCPDGIDVYFDNVGGELSDTVIKQMAENSHIILCGQISQYNQDVPYPPPISPEITKILQERKITRERFLVLNYPEMYEEALKQLVEWLRSGKLKVKETVEHGLENTPRAFISMMNGGNIGKQLVCVSVP
ncbi:prostaglandin reductase 2-like isoform X1 [Limulus polyphemus]|uniref:15-oxoprostaglandin 13-reductase n=2 Tax=Limulus polyphemus TaxID=6850 RepID=A0ABM1B3G6_LIMPO|nr:prostaglandin reductase 2-like isoform X1 [Limulus polyphemus]